MNLASVEKIVRERIGLDVASIGVAALPRIVANRMGVRGLASVEAYSGLLTNDSTEWSALVGELVVPETWFYRGGLEFFEHLARGVRTRLHELPNGRTFRILSVPCSTGEEPYSLALALDREGIPLSRCWIDGVDLARDHLLRAVTGRYSAFSFREANADPRSKYFQELAESRWELLPAFRESVRYRAGNLVEPGFLAAEPPYDLILCRNLFIYLTADARARALANLDRLLAPEGRLCLTAAEADPLPSNRYVSDGPLSFAIFRRLAADPAGPLSGLMRIPSKTSSGTQPVPPARSQPKSGVYSKPRLPAVPQKPVAKVAEPTCHLLDAGRSLADAGKLEAARVHCEELLVDSIPSAGLYSLLGVIHLAAGRSAEASEAFRKALYLDPECPEALSHMAVLCEQRGDPGQAEGLRRRLGRIEKGAPT